MFGSSSVRQRVCETAAASRKDEPRVSGPQYVVGTVFLKAFVGREFIGRLRLIQIKQRDKSAPQGFALVADVLCALVRRSKITHGLSQLVLKVRTLARSNKCACNERVAVFHLRCSLMRERLSFLMSSSAKGELGVGQVQNGIRELRLSAIFQPTLQRR